MSPSFFIVCALFVVHTAYGVLDVGEMVPDNWPDDMRDTQGSYQYVKDPDDCGFGYLSDLNGRVLAVYDCTKYQAFFSINFKICAVESVLRVYGEETCNYVRPAAKFQPRKDDPLCERPNEANIDPQNCQLFILCWDQESLGMLECPKGTGFDLDKQRCENLTPSTANTVCGNRDIPLKWIQAEN